MTTIACAGFLAQVKHHFSFLFDRYGARIAHVEDAPGGDRCLVILESQGCRVKFVQNRGDVYVSIGALASPICWEDAAGSTRHWYEAGAILAYLTRRSFRIEELLRDQPIPSQAQQLAELSRELQSLWNRVTPLFREEVIETWREQYRWFEEEREREFKKQYEQWRRARCKTG